jgi:hypothetical protein
MRKRALGRAVSFAAVLLLAGLASGGEPAARRVGIYVAANGTSAGEDSLERLHGTIVQKIRQTGMLKVMLTGGHLGGDVIGTLEGARAAVRTPAGRIGFRFRLNTGPASPTSPDMGGTDMMSALSGDFLPPQARRADEFVLVRLQPKGNTREGHVGGYGGRSGSSGASKDSVPFTSEQLSPGEFRVSPREPLVPGEYAFYFGAQGPGGQLFDFGVDAN